MVSKEELEKLKASTSAFMNHVYFVSATYSLIPDRNHHGLCINYNDLQEARDEFCSELVNCIVEWVYSAEKARKILDTAKIEGRTDLNAMALLINKAKEKFRKRVEEDKVITQGQFGELLLFVLLQHFFNAVPLVRKMPITTSIGMERFGADAIHYTYENGKNLLYLGEAKTYTSDYSFAQAFTKALDSILKSYKDHRSELSLYIYDDFIDSKLERIAQDYKNSKLPNIEVHLVSIIVYNETNSLTKSSEAEIKRQIIDTIKQRGEALNRDIFESIDAPMHPRFNYIILPVWHLEQLLKEFEKQIGR